ncbi:MAG: hypothetical protein NVS9B11_18230 [Candidatus Dormibacteraceae bacterium]
MLARIEVRKFRTLMAIAGLALVLSMILGFAVPAAARENRNHDGHHATLFATGQAGGVLLAIDVEKGSTAVIGPTNQQLSLALAITSDGSAAYTIAKALTVDARLARIDLATGAATIVGSSPLGNLMIMGMTFSPDGVLYAAGDFDPSRPTTFNSLYTIDLTTGSATRVGSFGVGLSQRDSFIMSFAFDSDGNMYGASQTALYRIHLPGIADAEGREARTDEAGQGTAALATKVVDFVESPARTSKVMGIAIGEDGNFYAADFRPTSTIYAVDVETGFLKPLFPSIALVHNIAFSPRGHHD